MTCVCGVCVVCACADEALEAELAVEQAKIKEQLEKAESLRKDMDQKQAQLKAAKKQGQLQRQQREVDSSGLWLVAHFCLLCCSTCVVCQCLRLSIWCRDWTRACLCCAARCRRCV